MVKQTELRKNQQRAKMTSTIAIEEKQKLQAIEKETKKKKVINKNIAKLLG